MGMAADQWSEKNEVEADLHADWAALIGRAAAGRSEARLFAILSAALKRPHKDLHVRKRARRNLPNPENASRY